METVTLNVTREQIIQTSYQGNFGSVVDCAIAKAARVVFGDRFEYVSIDTIGTREPYQVWKMDSAGQEFNYQAMRIANGSAAPPLEPISFTIQPIPRC